MFTHEIIESLQLTTGAFLQPFTNENNPPPIAPIANAAPQSSTIRYGLKESMENIWKSLMERIRISFRNNRKWYHMTILNCLKKTYFIFFVLIVSGHFLKLNLINELNTT